MILSGCHLRMHQNLSHTYLENTLYVVELDKGPFMYYVGTFLGFFYPPPPYVSMFLVLRISKNWHFWPPPLQGAYVIYEWSLRVLITDSYKLASSFLYVNVFATVSKEMIRMNYSVKLRMSATTAPFSHKHASPPAIFLLFLATRASKTPEANKLWFEKLVFMFMNINVLSFIW